VRARHYNKNINYILIDPCYKLLALCKVVDKNIQSSYII
jgi:hypothetical protein